MSSSELGKALRREVKTRVWPLLKQIGFDDFSDLGAWRHSAQQIDCVQFQTMPPRFGIDVRLGSSPSGLDRKATPGTFQLAVGTYYSGVHLLPTFGEVPKRPRPVRGESSKGPTCHREISLSRSILMGNLQGTVFYVEPDGANLSVMVDDALKALIERGLPWLEETRDLDAYLQMTRCRSHAPFKLELDEETQKEAAEWMRAQGVQSQAFFGTAGDGRGLPPGLAEAIRKNEEVHLLRDHVALDCPPSPEAKVALLANLGRWEQALGIQREAADPQRTEKRHEEFQAHMRSEKVAAIMSKGEISREISWMHKMDLKILARQQELLAELEEAHHRFLQSAEIDLTN